MTLQTLYSNNGGDYGDAIARFKKEETITKFLKMLLKDPTISELKTAFLRDDTASEYQAAHTLKGVASNLALTSIAKISSELCSAIKNNDSLNKQILFSKLLSNYESLIEDISLLLTL